MTLKPKKTLNSKRPKSPSLKELARKRRVGNDFDYVSLRSGNNKVLVLSLIIGLCVCGAIYHLITQRKSSQKPMQIKERRTESPVINRSRSQIEAPQQKVTAVDKATTPTQARNAQKEASVIQARQTAAMKEQLDKLKAIEESKIRAWNEVIRMREQLARDKIAADRAAYEREELQKKRSLDEYIRMHNAKTTPKKKLTEAEYINELRKERRRTEERTRGKRVYRD